MRCNKLDSEAADKSAKLPVSICRKEISRAHKLTFYVQTYLLEPDDTGKLEHVSE